MFTVQGLKDESENFSQFVWPWLGSIDVQKSRVKGLCIFYFQKFCSGVNDFVKNAKGEKPFSYFLEKILGGLVLDPLPLPNLTPYLTHLFCDQAWADEPI